MCLHVVDKEAIVKEGIGYKGFFISHGEINSEYQTFGFTYEKWVKDDDNSYIRTCDGEKYKTGFHLYKTRREARNNYSDSDIRKIKFRKVVATGTQNDDRVIVAREIYILKGKV
jgi:hypothetical protein